MKITNVTFTDFDNTTIQVTAEAVGKQETFYIQTVDGEYRSDLGCWITTDSNSEDINHDDYESFDMPAIIEAAENFLNDNVEEEETSYTINNEDVYLLNDRGTIKIVTKNRNFINSATSSYQRRFSDPVAEFDSKEEAIEYLESLE